MSCSFRFGALIFCGLLPAVAGADAGQLPDRFTLGRYMPGDVWFYMHGVRNEERAWLDAEWAEVFDALKVSGIDRDIISLLDVKLGEGNRAVVDKWLKLVKAVTWRDLVAEEVAIGEHFGLDPLGPEYIVLMRSKPGTLDRNMEHLTAILTELAALKDDSKLRTHSMGGIPVWSLTLGDEQKKDIPFSLQLFRKGDMLGVTTGRKPLKKIVGLMTGQSDKPAIVAVPRFREALGLVKPPEDMVIFFDTKSFLSDMKRLLQLAGAKVNSRGEPDCDPAGIKVLQAIKRGVELCDVMDYTITSMETEGFRELTHEVMRLQPAKRNCAVVSCCLRRKAFQRFDQFIPVDATGFKLSGFVDLGGLYKIALDFVENDIPDGAELIAKWNAILATIGFDPERDLFSWLSGEMINVTLPPAVATVMGGSDWVWMVRVKDSELASQKLDDALSSLTATLRQKGQMLMVTPAAVSAEGFRQVTHPLLAMFLRPVVGVRGPWLMIGSTPSAIDRCLAVASGKAPSIVENARFKREGLIPRGPVLAASFADTSRFGQELAGVITAVGIGGNLAAGLIPGDQASEARQVLQKIMSIVAKLGPVVAKLDFYNSESSITTYDGDTIIRTEKVVTFKPPSKSEVKTAGAE